MMNTHGLQGIRIRQVEEIIGIRKSMIYRLIAENKFPPPMKLGRASLWLRSEVEKALADLASYRLKNEARCGGNHAK